MDTATPSVSSQIADCIPKSGWRDYANYRVVFDQLVDETLVRRGAFSVGTWKGNLGSAVTTESRARSP